MTCNEALLSLSDVSLHRRGSPAAGPLLDSVALDVWPGEHVAILGGRRHGKTALMRVMAGVDLPDAGVVRLDGEDLGSLSRGARVRRLRAVSYVPKEWRPARGRAALDHVGLPLLADGRPLVTAQAKAHEALERVGMAHCAGTATEDLAPLEVTCVALAQALVRRPRLLLVDEPGATTELGEREELLELLRALAHESRDLALVVTSRDVTGVAGATRVLTLSDGSLRGEHRPADADVLPFPSRRVGSAPEAPVA